MAQQPGYGYGGQYGNGVPGSSPPPPPPADAQPGPAGGRKKGRKYAAQGYDFGQGANVQQQLGGPPGQEPGPYDGYGQQPQVDYQQPTYGQYGTPEPIQQQYGQPNYGQPAPAVGQYQAPDAGYPPPAQPDMSGIVSGMSTMNVGTNFGGTPQPQPQQQAQIRPHLNQLYPTDLLSQPFLVSELDMPPPPMVLPPNVRLCSIDF